MAKERRLEEKGNRKREGNKEKLRKEKENEKKR